jgi:hypothetical protein
VSFVVVAREREDKRESIDCGTRVSFTSGEREREKSERVRERETR